MGIGNGKGNNGQPGNNGGLPNPAGHLPGDGNDATDHGLGNGGTPGQGGANNPNVTGLV